MKKIYILGFGCGEAGQVTLETLEILKKSDKVFVRTKLHPACEILDRYSIEYTSFDSVYEKGETFEAVYEKISDTVAASPEETVSYIVPGSAVFAEKAVLLICEKADCEVKFIPSVSFLDGIFSSLKKDAADGFKLIDALSIADCPPDVSTTNIICQVYDRFVASDLKLELMRYYPAETPVILISAASTSDEVVEHMELFEIDRSDKIDHLTSLVIPPVNYLLTPSSFYSFVKIIKQLRSEEGCPWDREQTHETLTRYLIEEAYECVEAIQTKDTDNMCEELGDILLQVVLHANIAQEEGYFDINDVIERISKKMIRRHPHVFNNTAIEKDLDTQWDKIKNEEHAYSSLAEKLESIPKAFPALLYAEKLVSKIRSAGYGEEDADTIQNRLYAHLGSYTKAQAAKENEALPQLAGSILLDIVELFSLNSLDTQNVLRQSCSHLLAQFKQE